MTSCCMSVYMFWIADLCIYCLLPFATKAIKQDFRDLVDGQPNPSVNYYHIWAASLLLVNIICSSLPAPVEELSLVDKI